MSFLVDSDPIATERKRAARLRKAHQGWVTRIGNDVANAQLTYRVSGTGEGSVASRITAGKHVIFADEPAGLAGDDCAPSPVEIALGGLISCHIVVYRLYAQNLGIILDSINIEAEADLDARGLFNLDDTVRPGFTAVRLAIHVTGPETAERYEELRHTVTMHCPVLDIFANPTPITGTISVN